MIVMLNGYPGVGKLTVAQELAPLIGARMLDIHTVYNVAFALTEFKSAEFFKAVEDVEAIAYDLIRKLPDDVPVVMTTVLAGTSDWGDAEWRRLLALGRARPPFCMVHLDCAVEENIRRIQSDGRGAKRKPRDAEMARRNQTEAKPLARGDVKHLLRLDVTRLSPAEAARKIADWLKPFRPIAAG